MKAALAVCLVAFGVVVGCASTSGPTLTPLDKMQVVADYTEQGVDAACVTAMTFFVNSPTTVPPATQTKITASCAQGTDEILKAQASLKDARAACAKDATQCAVPAVVSTSIGIATQATVDATAAVKGQ